MYVSFQYIFCLNIGGDNLTIGIRSIFGKKGHIGPRLILLIFHLAVCNSLFFFFFSLFFCFSFFSFISLFSNSLSFVSCLFSLIFLLFLLFLFFLISLSLFLSVLLCSRWACRGRVSKPIILVSRPVPRLIPRPKP